MTGDGAGGGGGCRVREANRFSTSNGVFCCKRGRLRADGSFLGVLNVKRWADENMMQRVRTNGSNLQAKAFVDVVLHVSNVPVSRV
jgi:hypothetical protein